MAIALIIFTFLGCLALCWLGQPVATGRLRIAFLKTCILIGLAIAVLTEGLNLFHKFAPIGLIPAWSILLALVAVLLSRCWRSAPSQMPRSRYLPIVLFDPVNLLALGAIGLTLAITLTTALISAPNTWDVMTYHLPRVMHWLQRQSVEHYPTHELRQLLLPPGASYAVAQLIGLAGSDIVAHLVQWVAYLGCIAGVSLTAGALVGPQSEVLAALLCASLPMAIMQAVTAQTDLLTAFWLVCFIYFTLGQGATPDWFWAGAALALGILTKPTILLFALPIFALATLAAHLNQRHGQGSIVALVRSTLVAGGVFGASFSLSLPFLWRNWQLFGRPLDDLGTRTVSPGLGSTLAIALKNLALSLPIPGIWPVLGWLHRSLGMDIDDLRFNFALSPLTAPDSSPTEALFKVLAPHEDFVGYPVHLGLLILGLVTLWRKPVGSDRSASQPLALSALTIANLTGFVLFCLLLKWQPWNNRLLLPWFVANVPLMATGLDRTGWFSQPPSKLGSRHSQTLAIVITFGLSLMAIAYALTPMRHPLVSLPIPSGEQSPSILSLDRGDRYFSGARKDLKIPYQQAMTTLEQANCDRVGLVLGGDDWEYPLWVLAQRQILNVNLQHIQVPNVSSTLPPAFPPSALCGILVTRPDLDMGPSLNSTWQFQQVSDRPFLQLGLRSTKTRSSSAKNPDQVVLR